ncbi:hypothetical protein [Rhodopirellula sp. MGV]|uniref:hypothetical protein n=1 Tax=Rhodopirellula sp. MGV TaxID=2023130 RepID=UPI000BC98637|nr:hypothetical protein [Rhodopirellula sp. MGV]OYP35954.1 hypothetical protein CGZ80_09330 [Rhodopirellula sp. MGV]
MTFGTRRIAIISRNAICFAVACASLMGLWSDTAQAGERWTDLYGKHTIEADFIGLWGNTVVLQMNDGRRVSVSMDKLIAESRIRARQLEETQKKRRGEMRSLIENDAKEASAPAPTPLPEPPSVAPYQPYSGGGDVLSMLEWQNTQTRNGHVLLASYDMMPASYQADFERLTKASIEKLDPAGLDQVLKSVHSIGELIVTRQRWLFSYPRLSNIDEVNKETLKKATLAIGGIIRDGLDPEKLALTEIPNRPLRDWVKDLDSRVAPYIANLGDLSESLGMPEITYDVTNEADGKATVETKIGSTAIPVDYVQVEGKWMPADKTKEGWAELTKSWENGLTNTPSGSLLGAGQATMVTLMIDGFVQSALNAASPRELHAQMDTIVEGMKPLLSQIADARAAGQRMRGNGNSSSSSNYDYGSGYGTDYGSGMDSSSSSSSAYEEAMRQQSSGYEP